MATELEVGDNQIESVKQIGMEKSDPVFEVVTKGGFHMVIAQGKDKRKRTLGSGSMSPIARFIAQKSSPSLKITELSKGEGFSPALFLTELPKWVEITRKIQLLEKA